MHTPEIQDAIDLLKRNDFYVLRKERTTTIQCVLFVDDTLSHWEPPDEYVTRELAMRLSVELPKVWELKIEKLPNERRTKYGATVMVVKP